MNLLERWRRLVERLNSIDASTLSWIRRHPWIAGISGGAVVALIVAFPIVDAYRQENVGTFRAAATASLFVLPIVVVSLLLALADAGRLKIGSWGEIFERRGGPPRALVWMWNHPLLTGLTLSVISALVTVGVELIVSRQGIRWRLVAPPAGIAALLWFLISPLWLQRVRGRYLEWRNGVEADRKTSRDAP